MKWLVFPFSYEQPKWEKINAKCLSLSHRLNCDDSILHWLVNISFAQHAHAMLWLPSNLSINTNVQNLAPPFERCERPKLRAKYFFHSSTSTKRKSKSTSDNTQKNHERLFLPSYHFFHLIDSFAILWVAYSVINHFSHLMFIVRLLLFSMQVKMLPTRCFFLNALILM